MPDRELVCVGLELKFWDQAKPLLHKAISRNRGEIDLDDILERIKDERMQLWGIHDGELKAAMVTEVIVYPKKKYLVGVLIGGDEMSVWDDIVQDTLEGFARHVGASGIKIRGRRGWVKRLDRYGYQEYITEVIKELS